MSITSATEHIDPPTDARRRLRRRLRPLYVAYLFGGLALWVPVEKLFMAEIGFDAAGVGLMAAIYAGVVPLLEVPSGVLADRWSRKGVLLVAYGAIFASVLVCGAATTVSTYFVGAALLGVYLAMQSGTLDAMVYDVVVEELGDDAEFERTIGRLRAIESVALATSAIAGGLLAAITSARFTYVATLPLLGLAMVAIGQFRETRVVGSVDAQPSVRTQVGSTLRIAASVELRPIVVLTALNGVLVQLLIEFGALWLVAFAAPAFLFGAHWAGLTGALGVGSLLAGRLHLDCRRTLAVVGAIGVTCAVAMATVRQPFAVVVVQVVLLMVTMALGVHLMARLHAAIPSAVRAGVASGVSTITWMTFLPLSIAFGVLADGAGIGSAGWIAVAVMVALAVGVVAERVAGVRLVDV